MDLPNCPRPERSQKPRRVKMSITVDGVIYDMIQEKYRQGYSVSHIIDSCLWECFGRPNLSFEEDQ